MNAIKNKIEILENPNWSEFFSHLWDKSPVLFKRPFKDGLLSKDDLLYVLMDTGEKIRNHQPVNIAVYDKNRVYLSGNSAHVRQLTGLEEVLPTRQDHSLADYLNRLSCTDSYKEHCIYIQDIQSYQQIWQKARAFFKTIFVGAPISPYGMKTSIFLGNYPKTNFGAHKDPYSTFAYMVFGSRRFLLWPDQEWKAAVKNSISDDYVELDYSKFRPMATEVEIDEGDLLYWPSSYWHVGENRDDFSCSWTISYKDHLQNKQLDDVLRNTLSKVLENGYKNDYAKKSRKEYYFDATGVNEIPEDYYLEYQRLVSSFRNIELYKLILNSEWLRKLSGFGFSVIPPPRKSCELICHTSRIVSSKDYPLLFKKFNSQMVVSHSGIPHIVDYVDGMENIFNEINSGVNIQLVGLYNKVQSDRLSFEKFTLIMQELYKIRAIDILEDLN